MLDKKLMLKFRPSPGRKDKGIRKFVFLAKTQVLRLEIVKYHINKIMYI